MAQQPTAPAPETKTDAYCIGLDIIHQAASQDGTLDTAIAACQRIEDLCFELLRVLRG